MTKSEQVKRFASAVLDRALTDLNPHLTDTYASDNRMTLYRTACLFFKNDEYKFWCVVAEVDPDKVIERARQIKDKYRRYVSKTGRSL